MSEFLGKFHKFSQISQKIYGFYPFLSKICLNALKWKENLNLKRLDYEHR